MSDDRKTFNNAADVKQAAVDAVAAIDTDPGGWCVVLFKANKENEIKIKRISHSFPIYRHEEVSAMLNNNLIQECVAVRPPTPEPLPAADEVTGEIPIIHLGANQDVKIVPAEVMDSVGEFEKIIPKPLMESQIKTGVKEAIKELEKEKQEEDNRMSKRHTELLRRFENNNPKQDAEPQVIGEQEQNEKAE